MTICSVGVKIIYIIVKCTVYILMNYGKFIIVPVTGFFLSLYQWLSMSLCKQGVMRIFCFSGHCKTAVVSLHPSVYPSLYTSPPGSWWLDLGQWAQDGNCQGILLVIALYWLCYQRSNQNKYLPVFLLFLPEDISVYRHHSLFLLMLKWNQQHRDGVRILAFSGGKIHHNWFR